MAKAQALGDELFASQEYMARTRTDEEYVQDLYWGYLQRPADEDGYRFWLEKVRVGGREATRRTGEYPGYEDSDEFIALLGSLCSGAVTSAPQWQLTDRLGSVRVVTNRAGAIIGRHDPLPFGDITDEANEAGTSLQSAQPPGEEVQAVGEAATGTHTWHNTIRTRYAGMEADAETGLEHTGWRKYDGWQGRWTSPDPYLGSMSVGDPQSFNRYAYVQNDPVNMLDPTGLDGVVSGTFAIDPATGAVTFIPAQSFSVTVSGGSAGSIGNSLAALGYLGEGGSPLDAMVDTGADYSGGGDPGAPQTGQPPIDTAAIRSELERLLSNPDCANFVKDLIDRTSKIVGSGSPLVAGGDVLKIFDKIVSQGGLIRSGQPGSQPGGAQAPGFIGQNNAQIQLGIYQGAPPSAALVRQQDGATALQETLHHAGERRYYDYDYARGISQMPGMPSLPAGTGDPYNRDRFLYSGFFHPKVRDRCK